jgi:hypothetical protein
MTHLFVHIQRLYKKVIIRKLLLITLVFVFMNSHPEIQKETHFGPCQAEDPMVQFQIYSKCCPGHDP